MMGWYYVVVSYDSINIATGICRNEFKRYLSNVNCVWLHTVKSLYGRSFRGGGGEVKNIFTGRQVRVTNFGLETRRLCQNEKVFYRLHQIFTLDGGMDRERGHWGSYTNKRRFLHSMTSQVLIVMFILIHIIHRYPKQCTWGSLRPKFNYFWRIREIVKMSSVH